jgi:ATP-dependent exoDNAse (exonuclease V) beta subunit
MVMLPCTRSKVSKTGLIHLNNRQYLVPDGSLYCRWVEVRYDPLAYSSVYVWFSDRYYGEAHLYAAQTDYLKRQEQLEMLEHLSEQAVAIPAGIQIPPYSYLERRLAAHRQEVAELELNEALIQVKTKKDQVKAELIQTTATASPQPSCSGEAGREFGLDSLAYLLTVLLKRTLDAHDRLALATVWRTYGPFSEDLVRKTAGRLLGEGHPASDLMGYLDALRLAAVR